MGRDELAHTRWISGQLPTVVSLSSAVGAEPTARRVTIFLHPGFLHIYFTATSTVVFHMSSLLPLFVSFKYNFLGLLSYYKTPEKRTKWALKAGFH